MKIYSKTLLCAGVFVVFSFNALADPIYTTAPNYNGNSFLMQNNLEIGNSVHLQTGSLRTLTNFTIEFYSPNTTLNANLGIDIKMYANDGASVNTVITPSGNQPASGFNAPGTLLYDSGFFYNTYSGLNSYPANPGVTTLSYTAVGGDFTSGAQYAMNGGANTDLPTDFTFTVTFQNIGSDKIQLPLSGGATQGGSYDDYWIYNSFAGQWELLQTNTPANFIVDFSGVPEPSVFGLGALGSLLLLGARQLKRKS
jgi:hypothetical protein